MAKELAKNSAPVGAAILVAEKVSGRPPTVILAPTSALKKKEAKLAREEQSRQGMWEANTVGVSYLLRGVATPYRGLHEAS
jgi:hypothetical protein